MGGRLPAVPRPRRKSEAPKLRLIRGGAQAVVPQRPLEARPSEAPPARGSTASSPVEPEPTSAPPVESDAVATTTPAPGRRRAWVAAVAIGSALLLAYLALRR